VRPRSNAPLSSKAHLFQRKTFVCKCIYLACLQSPLAALSYPNGYADQLQTSSINRSAMMRGICAGRAGRSNGAPPFQTMPENFRSWGSNTARLRLAKVSRNARTFVHVAPVNRKTLCSKSRNGTHDAVRLENASATVRTERSRNGTERMRFEKGVRLV
jgi:hypothetical protein